MATQMTPRPTYRPLLYFMGRYKLLYGSMLALTLVTAVLESIGVAAFFPLFSSLLGESEGIGGILGFIADLAERMPLSDPIEAASLLLIVVFGVKTVLVLMREALFASGGAKVLYDIKRQVLEQYSGAHYQFFLDSKQGTLLYNLLDASTSVSNILNVFMKMAVELFKIMAIVILLAVTFPVAGLAFLGLGLAYYIIVHHISRKVSYQLGTRKARSGTEQTIIANEFISGIRQIITLRAISRWNQRFDTENRIYRDLVARDRMWMAVPRPIMELAAVGLLVGFILALKAFTTGGLSEILPRLGLFAMAMVQILPSLTSFGRFRMELMGQLPRAELVYHTFTAPGPTRVDGDIELQSFEQGIAFENVSFAHKGRDALMQDVDIAFDKGKVTAIVGPSGSGKTTIINLILGLFQPTSGRITVDRIPLQDLKNDTWLAKIGFVSQDPFTSHTTVAENILFGRNGHSRESVANAAKIANAHGFISELPQGYDTMVGDRGMTLSGGQQQRIAIARAVLDSPEILIFDEATSSLDTISEKLVQEAIDNVSADRTVIVIAHRLSTIRHADKIIVIDNGQVVEQGTHNELLDQDGQYSGMVSAHR